MLSLAVSYIGIFGYLLNRKTVSLQNNLLRTLLGADAASGTFLLVNMRNVIHYMNRIRLAVLFT
jgi:hypothetical protein